MMDIHSHSNRSDGTYAPEEIVALAAAKGLDLIALTDHDTVTGLEAFCKAAQEADIPALTGLEADSRCDAVDTSCEIHLLAYGFAPDAPELSGLLVSQRRKRVERNGEILDLLAARGYPVQIQSSAADVINRMHIAQALIEAGYALDIPDAFARFLGPGGLARPDMEKLPAADYIELIHSLGGLVVWAHPLLMRGDWTIALEELHRLGLDGVEVYYPAHRGDGMAKLRAAALARELMITTGSDFHGANRAHVPYGVMAELANLDPEIHRAERRLTDLALR